MWLSLGSNTNDNLKKNYKNVTKTQKPGYFENKTNFSLNK